MNSRQVHERVPVWDVADRLRKALRDADVSVADMAEYLGVSRNTVGNYINGRTEPGLRTLRLWAMNTDVPLGWLTGAEGDDGNPSPFPPSTRRYLGNGGALVTVRDSQRVRVVTRTLRGCSTNAGLTPAA